MRLQAHKSGLRETMSFLSLLQKGTSKMRKIVLAIMFVGILFVGCGGGSSDTSTTVENANLSGTWRGTSTSSQGTSSITFTIAQSGSSFTGTWVSNVGGAGTVSGTVGGSDFTITIQQTTPSSCIGTFNGNGTVSDNSISYSYSGTSNCSGYFTATGTATKQ